MKIDWPQIMRAELGRLRLRPDQFWGLTPGELRLMLGEPVGIAPMGRSSLENLAASYPDEKGTENGY